jgi:hypothetical protein
MNKTDLTNLIPKGWKKNKKRHGETYEIIKTSRKPPSEFDRIIVDGKEYKFGKRTNALRVMDKSVAMDIKQALPNDVVVYPVDDVPRSREERDHKWFHAVPELPWHKDKK